MLTCEKYLFPYLLCNDERWWKYTSISWNCTFFNGLTNSSCCVKDYQFAEIVYKRFNCPNLYKYTLLYNHTNTLLFTEIMMVYWKVVQNHFQMYINHFLGIPGLSFDIILEISKAKLEFIS